MKLGVSRDAHFGIPYVLKPLPGLYHDAKELNPHMDRGFPVVRRIRSRSAPAPGDHPAREAQLHWPWAHPEPRTMELWLKSERSLLCHAPGRSILTKMDAQSVVTRAL